MLVFFVTIHPAVQLEHQLAEGFFKVDVELGVVLEAQIMQVQGLDLACCQGRGGELVVQS